VSQRAAFRVVIDARGDADRELCLLGDVVLERRDEGLFVLCDLALADATAVGLALAGMRAEAATPPVTDPRLVPALMSDLLPCPVAGCVDRVSLRAVGEGEAISRALRRPLVRFRRDRGAAQVASSLLRGADRMYAWRRVVWATPGALRSRPLRGARPVVFDRAAILDGPQRFGLVSAGAIATWLAA
jgi:hypothetical protein